MSVTNVNVINKNKKDEKNNRKIKITALLIVFAVFCSFCSLSIYIVSAEDNPVYSNSDSNSDSSVNASADGNGIVVHMNTDGLIPPPDITAKSAVVYNLATDDLVYEKNSGKIVYPASTVKIMTAILVLENIKDLDGNTIISKYVADNTTGKNINAAAGEVFTVRQLLNAMLLYGANDAALALAECVSGSVDVFVSQMNEKAKELGCVSTVFTNPSGMHSDSMYTTAADVAKIAKYASRMDEIMTITSSATFVIPETNKWADSRNLPNRNYFASKAAESKYYYPYARGMNAGNTDAAGYCLVTVAEQGGLLYLCVIMGSAGTPSGDTEIPNSFSDGKELLNWVFSLYSLKTVVKITDKIDSPVIKLAANKDIVTLVPDEDISILLPQNVDMDNDVKIEWKAYEETLTAPIVKGDCLGEISVFYKGELQKTSRLLANADIERSNVLFVLDQIKGIVNRIWFKASVIIFIILFAFYIGINLLKHNKREKKRFY